KFEYHCPRLFAMGTNERIATNVPAKASQPRLDFFCSRTNGSATITIIPKTDSTRGGRTAATLMVAGFILKPRLYPLPLGEGRVRVSRFDQTYDPHPALRAALSQRERDSHLSRIPPCRPGFD